MIVEDKLVAQRLQAHPEFLLRLHEVLVTWDLGNKPALFLQARPAVASTLAIANAEVRRALREGVHGETGWWGNFEAVQAIRSFHGITGLVNTDSPSWLTELHRDGHMMAGVWEFPTASERDSHAVVIADWYCAFFEEFFTLVANVAEAGSLKGDFQGTATLVNANALRYATSNQGRFIGVAGGPCLLKNVQWPVSLAQVGSQQWFALAKTMAEGLAGAYRARLTR